MTERRLDIQSLRASPLDHLDWFCGWGGRAWERLVRHAVVECLGTDLSGKRVLELGPRQGRMSCLLGLLGAEVLGVDLRNFWLEEATETARSFGVDGRVRFIQFDGELECLPERDFDIVFTKSVLVVTADLKRAISGLHALLKPGGRGVFIENARGGPLLRSLRWLKHLRRWDYTGAHYFSDEGIRLVEGYFSLTTRRSVAFPPIVLLAGNRREPKHGPS